MRRTIAVIVLLCGLLASSPALAGGGGDAVIRDCVQHGHLTGTYTQAQYEDALQNLPADLQEYSNCGQIIAQAKRAAAAQANQHRGNGGGQTTPPATGGSGGSGGTGGTGGSGGGAAPSTSSGGGQAGAQASSGGGAKVPATPAHRNPARPTQATTPTAPVLRPLTPADLRPATATAADRGLAALPTPLVIVLVLLGVVALAGLAAAAWRRLGGLAGAGLLRRVIPRRGT